VLKQSTPVYEYEPHTWGPREVGERVLPAGGWEIPVAEEPEDFRVVDDSRS